MIYFCGSCEKARTSSFIPLNTVNDRRYTTHIIKEMTAPTTAKAVPPFFRQSERIHSSSAAKETANRNIPTAGITAQQPSSIVVRLRMTPVAAVLGVNDPMEDIMKKFEKTNTYFLPVVDVDNHLIGFVSRTRIYNMYRKMVADFSAE